MSIGKKALKNSESVTLDIKCSVEGDENECREYLMPPQQPSSAYYKSYLLLPTEEASFSLPTSAL